MMNQTTANCLFADWETRFMASAITQAKALDFPGFNAQAWAETWASEALTTDGNYARAYARLAFRLAMLQQEVAREWPGIVGENIKITDWKPVEAEGVR